MSEEKLEKYQILR